LKWQPDYGRWLTAIAAVVVVQDAAAAVPLLQIAVSCCRLLLLQLLFALWLLVALVAFACPGLWGAFIFKLRLRWVSPLENTLQTLPPSGCRFWL